MYTRMALLVDVSPANERSLVPRNVAGEGGLPGSGESDGDPVQSDQDAESDGNFSNYSDALN